MRPYILHIDMDAFYASVEQREHPELQGKPVIVGNHPGGRGVVCSASYPAREFGVKAGMPLTQATRLCPQAFFVPVRMGLYEEITMQIMDILRQYSPLVEPISLDEAFIDLTGTERLFGPPAETAKQIKLHIKSRTAGLTASVGLASNKFLAKVASELEKPDGLVVFELEQEKEILWKLPVNVIWGVGSKTEKKLSRNPSGLGFDTVGSIARAPREYFKTLFGKVGEVIHELACGIDLRLVDPSLREYISAHRPGSRERTNPDLELAQPKSCGHSVTFEHDQTDMEPVEAMLLNLCEKVGYRLRKMKLVGRTVTLTIRLSDFYTFSHARTMTESTNQGYTIYQCCLELMQEINLNLHRQPIRLVGVSVSNLIEDDEHQLLLFDQGRERRSKLYQTVDRLSEKYGDTIIYRASIYHPEETIYK